MGTSVRTVAGLGVLDLMRSEGITMLSVPRELWPRLHLGWNIKGIVGSESTGFESQHCYSSAG